jgi:cytochrome d ubiquinol oxidase subunit II
VTLGALLQGIAVEGREYAGGWWDWLTPFSVLTGISVVIGYALLGSTWLIMKTEGALQNRAFRFARMSGAGTIAGIVAVSIYTPFLEQAYYQRWFSWPNVLFAAQVPLLVAIVAIAFLISLQRRRERLPFLLALALFGLSMLGLGISVFPDIVPGRISIQEAAAPESSLVFMLIGAMILIPVILTYTAYSYWIFRGKVGHEGYH